MTQGENPVPKRVYDDISYEVKQQFIIESHKADQLYSGGPFAHKSCSPENGNQTLHCQIYFIPLQERGQNLPEKV